MFFQLNPKERAGYVALVIFLLTIAGVIGYKQGNEPPSSGSEEKVASKSHKPQVEAKLPASAQPATTSNGRIVVDVVGAVRHPGVYEMRSSKDLKSDPRISDAIKKAGGELATADLEAVNLAETLKDGEQIKVPLKALRPSSIAGNSPTPSATVSASSPTDPLPPESISRRGKILSGTVLLNSATLEELETLPGVGPTTAQRIIQWRQAHGRFNSLDDLKQVGGIGEKKLAKISPYLRL